MALETYEQEQRRVALERANNIRSKRSKLKKELGSHRRNPVKVILQPPTFAESMKIEKFLMAVPGLGKEKVRRLLKKCDISPSATLVSLSERQRLALTNGLKEKVWKV